MGFIILHIISIAIIITLGKEIRYDSLSQLSKKQ